MVADDLPTLGEFLLMNVETQFPRAAHVSREGFLNLYVRTFRGSITIAVVQAEKPGSGNWRALVKDLRRAYPNSPIYVESVGNRYFAEHLQRTGFELTTPYQMELCANYVLRPETHYDGL